MTCNEKEDLLLVIIISIIAVNLPEFYPGGRVVIKVDLRLLAA